MIFKSYLEILSKIGDIDNKVLSVSSLFLFIFVCYLFVFRAFFLVFFVSFLFFLCFLSGFCKLFVRFLFVFCALFVTFMPIFSFRVKITHKIRITHVFNFLFYTLFISLGMSKFDSGIRYTRISFKKRRCGNDDFKIIFPISIYFRINMQQS